MLNMLNNEQIGISAEIAIANFFHVPVACNYRMRGVPCIVNSITPFIPDIFSESDIPKPIEHVAERQSPIDFKLIDNKTLSVKTNKQKLGKSAPQKIGQPSSRTWFELLAKELDISSVPTDYEAKVHLFKTVVLSKSDRLLAIYWRCMFDCDFLVHIFNVVDKKDKPTNHSKYIVLRKADSPIWDPNQINFTKQTVVDWNESNTIKYGPNKITIGEFQVHNNRDNFKFRFDMAGIEKLIYEHQLILSR